PLEVKRILLQAFELHKLQQQGLPRPPAHRFVMVPREFWVILASEPLSVSQVVFEVLLHTIGYPGDGPDGHREWAALSYRHFERRGIMSRSTAERALQYAITRGYLRARPGQRLGKYASREYAIRWQEDDIVTL